MKILIIKFRNIGDVLLSTPLLENLRYHYPEAQIDYALNIGTDEILRLNPAVKNLFIYDRDKIKSKNVLKRAFYEIMFAYKILRNDYDIVINLTEGDRGAILALLSRAKKKLGYIPRNFVLKSLNIFDYIGSEDEKHTVLRDLQFINLLNKKIVNYKVSIYWSKEDEDIVKSLLNEKKIKRFVHVHPVSRWMFKCWEDDRMAKIIDYIQSKSGLDVIITAAPNTDELNRIENIISLCKMKPMNLSAQLTLRQLAYLSSRAELFFGVDTAPMHIAAAVNTPVIALFGASRIDLWGPWDHAKKSSYRFDNKVQYLGKHVGVSRINHETFIENGIKKSKGMQEITVQTIQRIIDEKL